MGTEGGTISADNGSTKCDEGVRCLQSNGVEVAKGNCVAEEILLLKSEAIGNGVEIADGNDVAITNGVAAAVGNGVTEEARRLESEAISNGVAISDGFDSADGNSSGLECFRRTYKRRKYVQKSSSESKDQEDNGECTEAASLPADQETFKIDKNVQPSLPFEWLSQRTQSEANGHTHIKHKGCSTEPHGHSVTEMCQHVLCNILTSEKFSSLCQTLLLNFQGMKPESVFDFSVINSRMKERAYEQSPTLFLSDIQQVWRKLQDTGNEIVALANILSNISRTSYWELFNNWESGPRMKPEQTEKCATNEACRRCGDMADGMNFLVCDSCEAMYHVSCIEPALRGMPDKFWYCANCTATGSGSTHENQMVCKRLNNTKTLNNLVGDESLPTNKEALIELEENLNRTFEEFRIPPIPNCKICGTGVDGDEIKICGHPFCPNKYYHVRCLSTKESMTYGRCWYCPSCLCQVCLADRDDGQIVLCDGCDHAYHIYCMQPPKPSIPRGKWFCRKCDEGIQAIRRAKKAYENESNKQRRIRANLEKKSNNKRVQELEKGGGMDMLLTAANSLNYEENLVAIPLESQKT